MLAFLWEKLSKKIIWHILKSNSRIIYKLIDSALNGNRCILFWWKPFKTRPHLILHWIYLWIHWTFKVRYIHIFALRLTKTNMLNIHIYLEFSTWIFKKWSILPFSLLSKCRSWLDRKCTNLASFCGFSQKI